MSIFSRVSRAIIDIPPLAWTLLLIAFIPFGLFPKLDLLVSRLFYTSAEGFFLKDLPIVQFGYNVVPIVLKITVAILLVLLVKGEITKRPVCGVTRKAFAFLIMSLVIGPGLVVNIGFKDYWGRARPLQVYDFGGGQRYSPPLIPSDQCETNCSFVSGHASGGFYFMSFALLARGKRKKDWMLYSIGLGSLFGLVRIVQGAHFLSDVVFCGFAIYFTTQILYNLFYPEEPQRGPREVSLPEPSA
ncbi:MAG: phosphatase PAP2 family protein [Alphaproteobacteria bacterium]|nr:phosphatase PAP2 family protein [Alphaproteobacteria bacterium]